MTILCEIVTQERLIYSDQVDMVVVDGVDGRMGILPNHSPLLTTLNVSELRVKVGDSEENFAIGGGVLEVRPDRVTILADVAERADEVDVTRAQEAREKAISYLEDGGPSEGLTPEITHDISLALQRANVRLKVGQKRAGAHNVSRMEDAG
ncbi:MAG TPA: ATP synthase F1 subunit epsilon [Chloroflexi bacterium]|nr:ATP synthase F1 subunit epsilon [Chloroflexota bacterium]|tara:strand:- start:197 stop:649 length:453 start_codon:yes stop_codon:yes gene_type:complete